jgi:SMODS-associated and fused to various effectors sensor domain
MTRDSIASELARCDAAMLWLGGGTLASDYVRNIELPLIFENNQARGLRIVPLFVDDSAQSGIDAVRKATGHEIGDHNGHVRSDDINAFTARVGSEEVRARLTRGPEDIRRPVLRCVTRSDAAGGREDADLNFDWIREYPSDGQLPDESTIDALQQALHRSVQHVISSFGPGLVDLYLSCHLHIGVALGYELRRVTGAVPRVAVGDDWWQCLPASPTADIALKSRPAVGQAGATRTAIEIALSRDTTALVSSLIATSDARYRERTHLSPEDGPDQQAVTRDNVNPWADQCADAIRRARSQPGVDSVDVLMAAPIGFAVALGWRLNAVGGVRLFHPEGNAGPYRHVWTLQAS